MELTFTLPSAERFMPSNGKLLSPTTLPPLPVAAPTAPLVDPNTNDAAPLNYAGTFAARPGLKTRDAFAWNSTDIRSAGADFLPAVSAAHDLAESMVTAGTNPTGVAAVLQTRDGSFDIAPVYGYDDRHKDQIRAGVSLSPGVNARFNTGNSTDYQTNVVALVSPDSWVDGRSYERLPKADLDALGTLTQQLYTSGSAAGQAVVNLESISMDAQKPSQITPARAKEYADTYAQLPSLIAQERADAAALVTEATQRAGFDKGVRSEVAQLVTDSGAPLDAGLGRIPSTLSTDAYDVLFGKGEGTSGAIELDDHAYKINEAIDAAHAPSH